MVNSNYQLKSFSDLISGTNVSDGTDGKQIAPNGDMNAAGAKVEQDMLSISSNPSPANEIAEYNDFQAYKEAFLANKGTSQNAEKLDKAEQELLLILGGSGSGTASTGKSSVNSVVQYMEDFGTQSNGVNLGADGAVDEAGSSLKAAFSAYAASTSSGSSGSPTEKVKDLEAVLGALTAVTTAMGKDGASKEDINSFRSGVEGFL
jgi:hypothetical protein